MSASTATPTPRSTSTDPGRSPWSRLTAAAAQDAVPEPCEQPPVKRQPHDVLGRVDAGERQRCRERRRAGRDELRQQGRVEHADLGVEQVREQPGPEGRPQRVIGLGPGRRGRRAWVAGQRRPERRVGRARRDRRPPRAGGRGTARRMPSRSPPRSPGELAAPQASSPAQVPRAVGRTTRSPPRRTLRSMRAMSGPGVTVTRAATPANARKAGSTPTR